MSAAFTAYDRGCLDGIRTRFVRDQLAETSFDNCGWIGNLAHWESLAAVGGPKGWASGMF